MAWNSFMQRLKSAFGGFAADEKPVPVTGPESITFPADRNATLTEHVRFLLDAKDFVANHPVPDEYKNSHNQYSHARRPLIGDDRSRPAVTNCSYEYFGGKRISIGFALFIEQADWVKDNKLNPAFNAGTLWDSFSKLLTHHVGDLGQGDTKYGYYLPSNHYYIEKPVSEEVFERAQPIIDFYTRTDIRDPGLFLESLSAHLHGQAPAPANTPQIPSR